MASRSEREQPNAFHPTGLLPNEVASVVKPLEPERWARAEEKTEELISRIQPNWPSEEHRNSVASYVRRLITECLPCQVFTFGSVPLKTYLPDGDIDLTAFSEDQNLKDKWADKVRDMLEKEERNEEAEFRVKEVQYIQAEVKIIKCLVDDIVVDISFNQLGGLCTLCFLEEVDNLISQNHLFKRSIILIKAWCYYESRILGAHHGLISTYALETLVLYIFHVFNNSFAGPLEVLYRFLEFFSKFDWANYCVSLWGPVPISSLPCMEADPPRKDGEELLLNKMFLSACSTAYSVFPVGQENQEQPFISKHFNVIDPLRINNNLGRSVSKGNFYRIRSAFSLGAQHLARIFVCQEESIEAEVNMFFMNTWTRHGKGSRPDARIIDSSHLRQVNTGHSKNLRKHTGSKKPTENSISHDPGPHHYAERSNVPKGQQGEGEETCMQSLQNRGHFLHQFARTNSSPELTNMSNEAASSCRSNVEIEKMDASTSSRSNYTVKTRGSCNVENHVAKRSIDEPPTREASSRHDPYTTITTPQRSSGRCVRKSVTDSSQSVACFDEKPSQGHQEVQHYMHLVSSSGIQNYGGHLQMPVNLVPVSPSMPGYSRHGFGGSITRKLISQESDLGTAMHYSHGPFPPHVSQHYSAVGVAPDRAEIIAQMNGGDVIAEISCKDGESSVWTDCTTGSIKEIDPECEEFSAVSSRLSPSSPAMSSQTKASSENSWDGKPLERTNTARPRVGNKTHSWNPSVNVCNGWQVGGEYPDQIYDDIDDDCRDRIPSSTGESVAPSVSFSDAQVHQLSGFGPAHPSYPNSVLPFAPLLVHPGSEQGLTHNHAVLPVAFYPAGPPVPFIAMMSLCNMAPETRTSGASQCQQEVEMGKPTFPLCQSGDISNSEKDAVLLSHTDNYNSAESTASKEHPEEVGPDIFHSDFASHWKNLQYGRLCQPSRLWHPFVYPPSVIVAPQHLQGHLPLNAPGKPSPGSANGFAHLVPVSALQTGSGKPAGVDRQHGEVSKHRNGTGTYFPNPNAFRDRRQPNTRQNRRDNNYDRNEWEANWKFNSKPRFTGRAQARYHFEKPNLKTDLSGTSTSQTDRPWDTLPHNHNRVHRFSKGSSTSRPAHGGPDNVDYTTYP